MHAVYTIGHSTRTIDEFLSLLNENGIQHLIDIRRYPGSKRYPHFGREDLRRWLERAGIAYTHEEALGGRRAARADSANTMWRNDQFRGYADHMDTPEFRSALERLTERARTEREVVMCAEAVPWRCHRQLLSDALVATGVDVVHILAPGKTQPHQLNPGAHILPNRHLVYPASGSQMDLL